MNGLDNVIKGINEISLCLANDSYLQRLLVIDDYNIDKPDFTPLTPQQMLDQHYICTTPQNEDGIKKIGRNTFLIISLESVFLPQEDFRCNAAVFVVTDINHVMVKNNKDRTLMIADRIIKNLNNTKITSASGVTVTSIDRINYTETMVGYRIDFKFGDQDNIKAEL